MSTLSLFKTKGILLILASFFLMSCAQLDQSPPEENISPSESPSQSKPQIQKDLLELQSDNSLLKGENDELRTQVNELNKTIEENDKKNEKRLEAMEDLISLMEQNVRNLEESYSRENFSSTEIQPISDQSDTTPLSADEVKKPGEGLSSVQPLTDLEVDSANAGKEPFGFDQQNNVNASLMADDNLNEPSNYPSLTKNPKAKNYYNRAYNSYTAKDYSTAIGQFEELIRLFPNDQYTDNAFFWIGMSHFHLDDLDKAETYYRRVLNSFKHGPTSMGFKTPDSIYMLGLVREKQGKWEEARYYYNKTIEKYPDSGSASNARNKLKFLVFKSS